jgi:hypothetical protein
MNNNLQNTKDILLFFIIGRPRSGTTLLRTLLDAHPNVIVPTECPFILQLARRYKKINCPDKKTIDKIITDLQKVWLFQNTKIDVELLRNNLYNFTGKLDYITLCKIIILHYPEIFPKNKIILVGDKNPSYSFRFKRLYKLFKNECKYIQIIRDPRDQFISLKRINCELPLISTAAKHWVYTDTTFNKIAKKNEANFMTIKYEDLVREPNDKLKNTNDFLGIPFDNNVLNFHEKKNEYRKQFSEEALNNIHKSLLNPINPDKIDLWKTLLSEKEKDIAEIITYKRLRIHGYESTLIRKPIYRYLQALPGILIHYFSTILVWVSYFLPYNVFTKLSKKSFLGYIWFKFIERRKRKDYL